MTAFPGVDTVQGQWCGTTATRAWLPKKPSRRRNRFSAAFGGDNFGRVNTRLFIGGRLVSNPAIKQAQDRAVQAARAAGALMRRHFRSPKKIHSATQHDIKLELDVRCQRLIERTLRSAYPHIAVLGEEGVLGDPEADQRWVVDPIDGTVNFAYGIPHACVSIALQTRNAEGGTRNSKFQAQAHPDAAYDTVVGVVYDPFCDELWTAVRG